MENKNDISKLAAAGIKVVLEDYSCGCWGKHHTPYIENATASLEDQYIVIEVGEGYRSSKHLHGQNVYVLETNPEEHIALIEMRKYGDMYGAGMWHYLIGIEGSLFIAQVPSTIDTLAEALESLKPAAVKRAEVNGADVKRQGDWYFIPVNRKPRGTVEVNQPLDDDHVADEAVILKTVAYARGIVTHGHHASLNLGKTWHKALQNNAIRTGRLAMGGYDD